MPAQTKKPPKPPIQSHIPHQTTPRPLQQPYQLHPAPKATQSLPAAQEPSDAEYATFGRAILASRIAERKAYQKMNEERQRQNQLVSEMVAKVGGEVDVCGLCGLTHVGEC